MSAVSGVSVVTDGVHLPLHRLREKSRRRPCCGRRPANRAESPPVTGSGALSAGSALISAGRGPQPSPIVIPRHEDAPVTGEGDRRGWRP